MDLKKKNDKFHSTKLTSCVYNTNVLVAVATTLLVLAFSIFITLNPNSIAEFFTNTHITNNIRFICIFAFTANIYLFLIHIIEFSKLGKYEVKPESNRIDILQILYSNIHLSKLRKVSSLSLLKKYKSIILNFTTI